MSPDDFANFAIAFKSILFEGAPFILLGTLLSGFLGVYLPAGAMEKLLPKNKFAAIFVSGLLGLLLPVCECAVVPVIRRLVAKGLPVSCAFAYMLAAPIVNPITILSTWNAFPDLELWPQRSEFFTFSRVFLGYLAAILVGLAVLRLPLQSILKSRVLAQNEASSGHHHHHEHDHHHHEGGQNRVVLAMRAALKDFTDVGVYFTIGVIITALFNVGIAPGAEWLESMEGSPFGQTAAFMVLAFLLSLCSTSDAFIAATLAADAPRTAARLGFLVFGPMMDVKLLFLYSTIMKPRFILWLALALFLFVGLAAVGWSALFEPDLLMP
ncbi:permease [Roseibacillus ishigakijimensis]|uniref:Permease n=1 Tax=Roseibacillus ishigakijimensis TaxID=454146 RepID=A0A934VG99_9BACT|nr:permease [Roseibacillus ishigakijimensis]MBK1832623.1 permease [Roseibacillus ishigakijimensis]